MWLFYVLTFSQEVFGAHKKVLLGLWFSLGSNHNMLDCVSRCVVASAPHCLLAQCWLQVPGMAEVAGAWEGGPTYPEEALGDVRDKLKGGTSQTFMYFHSPRELVKMQKLI